MDDITMTDATPAEPSALPPSSLNALYPHISRPAPFTPAPRRAKTTLKKKDGPYRVEKPWTRPPPPRAKYHRWDPRFRSLQIARGQLRAQRLAEEEESRRTERLKRYGTSEEDVAPKRLRPTYEHDGSSQRQVMLPGAFPQEQNGPAPHPFAEFLIAPQAPVPAPTRWRRIRIPVSRIALLLRNARRGIQQSIQTGMDYFSAFANLFTRTVEEHTPAVEIVEDEVQAETENNEAATQLCAELTQHASCESIALISHNDPVAAQLQAELSNHVSHLFPHTVAQSHNDLEVSANSISEVLNMTNEVAQEAHDAPIADDNARAVGDVISRPSNADGTRREQETRPTIGRMTVRQPAAIDETRPWYPRPMISHRLNYDFDRPEDPSIIHGRRRIHFIVPGVELTEAERNYLREQADASSEEEKKEVGEEEEERPASPAPEEAPEDLEASEVVFEAPTVEAGEEREGAEPSDEIERDEATADVSNAEESQEQQAEDTADAAEGEEEQQYALIPPLLPWLRRPILPPQAPHPLVPSSRPMSEAEIEETRDLLSATRVTPAPLVEPTQRPDLGLNPTTIHWWASDTPMGRPVSAVRLFHPHSPPVNIANRTAPLQQTEFEEILREQRRRLARERSQALRRNRVPRGQPAVRPLSEEREEQVEAAMSAPANRVLASTSEGAELTPQKLRTCYQDLAWLNDEVINGHLALTVDYLRAKAGNQGRGAVPKYYNFNSFFYTKLREGGYQAVSRWARRAKIHGEALLSVQTLFIPVHQSSHWTLLVVSPANRTIEYFDSLGSRASIFANNVKDWLRGELGDLYDEDEWTVLRTQSPQQNNGSDCGVFLLTTAKAVALGLEPTVYGPRDVPLLRRKIVAELLCGGFEGDLNPVGGTGETRL